MKFYPYIFSKYVQRVFYFHFGFDDRSLLWVVDSKIYDLFFIKLK